MFSKPIDILVHSYFLQRTDIIDFSVFTAMICMTNRPNEDIFRVDLILFITFILSRLEMSKVKVFLVQM